MEKHEADTAGSLFSLVRLGAFPMIWAFDVQTTAKTRKRIAERIGSQQCLCCDKPMLKRGLCYQCYYQWRKHRLSLPKAKRAEFDAGLIRRGHLLDQQAVRKFLPANGSPVFSAAAERLS